MGRLIGSTILDGIHGDMAEERARRGRRSGPREREADDDPPNPREKSRLDDLWNGRDNK